MRIFLSLNLLFTLFNFAHSGECKKTGQKIMEKQEKKQKVDYEVSVQNVILEDLKNGVKEARKLRRHSMDLSEGKQKTLTSFLEPNDIKGTALLNWKNKGRSDDQWLYLPALRKMQRIASSGKRKYFMGTDFTYSDLEGENLSNYDYKCLNTKKCGKKTCYVIEAIPKNKDKVNETGYSKRVLEVRKKRYTTVKVDYYDKKGKLLKSLKNSKWKKYGKGLWRAKKSVMTRHGFHETTMDTTDRKVNKKIEDITFTERYITKGMHTR
ncbi:MAG: outer membrane lipoprotein-sorting protein [Bacteriovoracaceae bacterium]|nr:outer membrane lipoprotein-sorting protein [Bacteriovoracaceae bacterium]